MIQPFEVLGISENPTWEEVNKAYKELCIKYHPDKHPKEEYWFYNDKMTQINNARSYYEYLKKGTKSQTSHEKKRAWEDYTAEEKQKIWEEWERQRQAANRAAYEESGRKMRAKIAKNLDPILDANKHFKEDIIECNNYNDLYNAAKTYAEKIDKMIHTMYKYTEKNHRYGMPPNHECYSEIHDENVNKDYPLIKVDSSQISAVGYDEGNKLLYIQFQNGTVYVYYNVVYYIYEGLLNAESKGKFFNDYIRKVGYKFTKLK